MKGEGREREREGRGGGMKQVVGINLKWDEALQALQAMERWK